MLALGFRHQRGEPYPQEALQLSKELDYWIYSLDANNGIKSDGSGLKLLQKWQPGTLGTVQNAPFLQSIPLYSLLQIPEGHNSFPSIPLWHFSAFTPAEGFSVHPGELVRGWDTTKIHLQRGFGLFKITTFCLLSRFRHTKADVGCCSDINGGLGGKEGIALYLYKVLVSVTNGCEAIGPRPWEVFRWKLGVWMPFEDLSLGYKPGQDLSGERHKGVIRSDV